MRQKWNCRGCALGKCCGLLESCGSFATLGTLHTFIPCRRFCSGTSGTRVHRPNIKISTHNGMGRSLLGSVPVTVIWRNFFYKGMGLTLRCLVTLPKTQSEKAPGVDCCQTRSVWGSVLVGGGHRAGCLRRDYREGVSRDFGIFPQGLYGMPSGHESFERIASSSALIEVALGIRDGSSPPIIGDFRETE